MTPADVAAQIGCTVEHVLALIRDLELEAIDIRRKGRHRPRWRIDDAALERFLARRSSFGGRPVRQRPKRRRLPPVKRHYSNMQVNGAPPTGGEPGYTGPTTPEKEQ